MLATIVVILALLVLRRQLAALEAGAATTLAPRRATPQLAQLTTYADRLYSERKWLAAEKAYLSVLKIDHKNITAYSHLGVIYTTQKNLADAIECFEIAARLRPSATTLQNLGVAYFDNRNYIKAIAAYEKAIMFEPSAHRYIGLSRAHQKLSNTTQVIAALEKATELEPTKKTLQLLAETYDHAGRKADMLETYRKIHSLDPSDAQIARKIGIHLPNRAPKA